MSGTSPPSSATVPVVPINTPGVPQQIATTLLGTSMIAPLDTNGGLVLGGKTVLASDGSNVILKLLPGNSDPEVTGGLFSYQGLLAISGSTPTVAPINKVTAAAPASGAQVLVFPATGDITFDLSPTAATTLTISGGTAGQRQILTLVIRQPSVGGVVVTLPANVKWVGGTTPQVSTTEGDVAVIDIMTTDGGQTYLGGM